VTEFRRSRWILQGSLLATILFAIVVAAQFVSATYGEGGTEPPPITPEDAPEADRGRVRIVDGIPIVRLSGTPREIGRQHGALLKHQLNYLRREYFEALAVPLVGRERLRSWGDEVEEFIPEKYREELKGLAEGAGISYRDALRVNAMVDRLQSVMCSTIVASGEATPDDAVYFGRNLDFPGRNVLQRMTIVFVYEPEGETPYLVVGWPGLIGALSGMNAHGVAGATMMIHRGAELKPGMPYPIMYREALARARKTSDVHDYIAQAKRTCPNNFMVVDASGTAEVVEFDQETCVARKATRGSLCSTNHFRSRELEKIGWPLGLRRYEILDAFLEERRGRIDFDGVRAVLKETAMPWFMNVQSMIFLPAKQELHLARGGKLPAAAQPFVHLDRATLFGAAAKPER
jgi:hypothetical protein